MDDFNFTQNVEYHKMDKGPNDFFGPRDENDWHDGAYLIHYDPPANKELEESQVKIHSKICNYLGLRTCAKEEQAHRHQ